MRATRSAPSLTVACLNTNGLNNAGKRRAVFRDLQRREDGVGVLCLQETHCPSLQAAAGWVEQGAGPGLPFRGPSAWAAGTSASRGVAVLVGEHVRAESFECVHRCPEGRVVGVLLSLGGRHYLVYSVYAPSEGAQRAAFFTGPLRAALLGGVQRCPGAELIVAGDFNCIESPALDQVGGGGSGGRVVGFRGGLEPLQVELGLVDSYRALHPAGRAFTHVATIGTTAARLDRVLVLDRMVPHLAAAGVRDGWQGDHRLAFATLSLPGALPRGPGDWVFPARLLADPAFVASMSARFSSWFAQRPVHTGYTGAQRWEAFKRYARDRVQLFDMRLRRDQRSRRAGQARRAAAAAREWALRPTDVAAADAWAEAQQGIQDAQAAAAAQAATFAGVLWDDWGESSTAWFHRLAEQRRVDSSIASLTVPSLPPGGASRVVSLADEEGRAAAAECIAGFYDGSLPSGLFRPRPTDTNAQDDMLASLDARLSPQARDACEGALGTGGIDADELLAALQACAPGKVPGADGLTYEFYRAFWPVVGAPLAAVFSAAFAQEGGRLPDSMLLGVVVLVYKGAGPRSDVACYRPLTMLNADYKLLAKAMARRFSPALSQVIDPTQTAFLSDRWIGDNVLQHLEEVDCLEASRQPGVIAFLDFEKAYDAISRPWVVRCMQALGFGPLAVRWVRLLLEGTRARCRFNGFHTRDFEVLSGVAQGSPLSPALFIMAAQPLASRLRHLQRVGAIAGIQLPDGRLAPPSNQHADDTTLHVPSLTALHRAWDLAVQPYCRASGSAVNASKGKALLLGAAADGHDGPFSDAATRMVVVGRDDAVRHLGVMLGRGAAGERAREGKFEAIARVVVARISHWSAYTLTHDGRAHLAQQCLASTLVYHATFSRPPPRLLNTLHSTVMRFVEGADALGGPCRAVAHLPRALGGRGVPCLPRVVDALQAGVICRLLHPARAPWKALAASWWASLDPPCAGLRSLLFAGAPAGGPAAALPRRVAGYVEGFWACAPHRITPLAHLPTMHLLREPLFGNPSVLAAGQRPHPLLPGGFPAAVAAGIHTVADLAAALSERPPPPPGVAAELRALYARLPPPLSVAVGPPSPPLAAQEHEHSWWEWPAPAGAPAPAEEQLLRVTDGAATTFTVEPGGGLTEVGSVPWPAPVGRPVGRPALVIAAPVGGPRRSRGHGGDGGAAPAGSGGRPMRLFYVGPWLGGARAPFDPTVWGLAGVPLLLSTTSQRTAALVQRDAAADGAASAASFRPGRPIQPAVWPSADGGDSALQQRERRWVETAAPRQAARRPQEQRHGADPELARTAAWMRPTAPRLGPAQRQQHRADHRLLEAPAAAGGSGGVPPGRAARARWWDAFDDPLGGIPAAARTPWGSCWRRLHRVPAPRAHRFLAWRVLHGSLPCAARLASWQAPRRSTARAESYCHHPGCAAEGQPETITHVLMDCPVARQATAWACRLWAAATRRPAPPCTAAVFLAGDRRAWSPGDPALQDLWDIVRLATLYFLWTARCRGRLEARVVPALAVVAQVVHYLRARISQDAIRAYCPPHAYACVGGEWVPDRPTLSPEGFQARWASHGVLCSRPHPDGPLQIRLTLVHPVPPPRASTRGG